MGNQCCPDLERSWEEYRPQKPLARAAYALQLAARSRRSNVVPVIAAPFPHEALPPALANLQSFDLTTGPLDERLAELIRSLKTREME